MTLNRVARLALSTLATLAALVPIAMASCAASRGVQSADASPPKEPRNLLSFAGHIALPFDVDPEASHRPVGCARGLPRVEDETLELATNDCVFFWVGIPIVADVRAGETLELVTTHGSLFARDPASAHLRIDLDEDPLIDRAVAIPSADAIDIVRVTSALPHKAGAMLRVHLHNHGQNNWRVISLVRAP